MDTKGRPGPIHNLYRSSFWYAIKNSKINLNVYGNLLIPTHIHCQLSRIRTNWKDSFLSQKYFKLLYFYEKLLENRNLKFQLIKITWEQSISISKHAVKLREMNNLVLSHFTSAQQPKMVWILLYISFHWFKRVFLALLLVPI